MPLTINGLWFKDEHGRTRLLRGVNLSGASKLPSQPDGATHCRDGFFDHRNVSFVGRPFPLDEADEHFRRLQHWGLTFLRFVVTWEAIEHAGPGQYDEDYLDYLTAVVKKAGDYGFDLYIDPHQDVWSRFSGGDGAPGWTFDLIGMDITKFAETGAAVVHQTYEGDYPRMIWLSNGIKLAAATMMSLFYGGDDFAPRTTVEGESIQQFLQRHYIAAFQAVARRLKGLPHVVGFGTMNEPFPGYIGRARLDHIPNFFRTDILPTPYESMLLGAGFPQRIRRWNRYTWGLTPLGHSKLVNPDGVSVWRDGYDCVWKQNGVWDITDDGTPTLLRPDHFAAVDGHRARFRHDYLRPFINRFAAAIRTVQDRATIFVETEAFEPPPRWSDDDATNVVYAPHWYDVLVLLQISNRPHFKFDSHARRLIWGLRRVRNSIARQMGNYKQWAADLTGIVPTLIGEFGLPFDLNNSRSFHTGDFSIQAEAFDLYENALDAHLLNWTIWNYNAFNTNAHGDGWNREDFSIFSRDQQTDPTDINSGGRALHGIVRPYALATAGEPLSQHFDRETRTFEFRFRHDPDVSAPTEVFVPLLHYPAGCTVEVSDGSYQLDAAAQRLTYRHTATTDTHEIRITPPGSG